MLTGVRLSCVALALLMLSACAGAHSFSPAQSGQSGDAARYLAPKAFQQNDGAQFAVFKAPCAVPLGQLSHGASTASMWFTVPAGCTNKSPGFVAKVAILTGQVTKYALGTQSSPLAIVESGNYVWVADQHASGGKRLVYRFNEDGTSTSYALPSAITVASLVAGPDGNLWFCGSYASGKALLAGYGYVTPSGATQLYQLKGSATPVPTSIAAGSDGKLYITDESGGNIDQITPSNGAVTTYSVGGHPLYITNSAGVLVYSDSTSAQLSVITKTGEATTYPAPKGQQPGFLARRSDGTVLYVDTANNSSAIGTFDPSTGTYAAEVKSPDPGLRYLYNGPDGNMWFTDVTGDVGAYLQFILTTSPASLSLTPPSCSATFTAAEPIYKNTFSVASQNQNVATVSPATGSAGSPFTVTGVNSGSTTILVQDIMQNDVYVNVAVSGACGGTGELVYVADNSQVLIYDSKTGIQEGSISSGIGGATGMDVDTAGNLYVANSDAEDGVEYPAGQSSPSVTFGTPGTHPWDITKCLDGTVYIAPLEAQQVAIYKNGSDSPTGFISNSDSTGNFAVHCDPSSNVYVAYESSKYNTVRVKEYPPGGGGSGTLLNMSGGNRSSLTVDQNGDVVFANTATQNIEFWAQGGSQPFKVISTLQKSGVLQYLKFDSGEQLLWVQVAEKGGTIAYALDPTSGSIVEQLALVTNGGPGLAIAPADGFAKFEPGRPAWRDHTNWLPPTNARPRPAPTTFTP